MIGRRTVLLLGCSQPVVETLGDAAALHLSTAVILGAGAILAVRSRAR